VNKHNELILYHGKVVCPRCDGNGLVYKTFITPLSVTVYLCDECDALWEANAPIRLNNFQDYSTYLEKHGSSYEEAEQEYENYEWYNES
jgi:transcription elongation factor Elf1